MTPESYPNLFLNSVLFSPRYSNLKVGLRGMIPRSSEKNSKVDDFFKHGLLGLWVI